MARLALAGVLCGGTTLLRAHGDLEIQIAEVSRQLVAAPSAALFLKRGELQHEHEDYAQALADYDRAVELDPSLDAVGLNRGRTLFKLARFEEARQVLDTYLVRKPGHAAGFLLRARVRAAIGDNAGAVADFDRNIALAPEPLPECFLERAEAFAALGDRAAAVRSLDEGIERLGNLVTLQMAAIDLEVALNRTDSALARLDRLRAGLPRQETWLVRRGEVLEAAGRRDEALREYDQAFAVLEQLSPRHRNVKPMRDLEARLRRILAPSISPSASPTHQPTSNRKSK